MTYIELAQFVFPGATTEQAESLLWNCTAFPFDVPEGIEKALREAYAASGGDVDKALAWSYEELDKAWENRP